MSLKTVPDESKNTVHELIFSTTSRWMEKDEGVAKIKKQCKKIQLKKTQWRRVLI